MTTEPENEGDRVYQALFGVGPRPRSTAPEPSLLPQLAAYLCHDFSIEEVLSVAFRLGCRGGVSPPWPSLWQATLWVTCGRRDLIDHLRQFGGGPTWPLDIAELGHGDDPARCHALFLQAIDEPDALGSDFPPNAAAAQLLRYLEPVQIKLWLKDLRFDPGELDAESVRTLLLAFRAANVIPDDGWFERAIAGAGVGEYAWSRQGHLLPHLPPTMRTTYADELARRLCAIVEAPDLRALVVSRVAPFVSSTSAFDLGQLRAAEPVWARHIDHLLKAPWPETPWGDVFRAHPEHEFFKDVVRPHEVTASAAGKIDDLYGLSPEEMAAPNAGGAKPSVIAPPPSIPTPSPAPEEPRGPIDRPITIGGEPEFETPGDSGGGERPPRALQADVSMKGEGKLLNAFVAGQEHQVVVSIGRGARIRADVAFNEGVFDGSDAAILKLPVFFVAQGQTQKGALWVPRDQSSNSTTQTFSLTAPLMGRVKARVHVMRPDGCSLLESALLIGDVVTDKVEAVAHDRPIEMITDVVAGNLCDPTVTGPDATVISDARTAQASEDGGLVQIDVSTLQAHLGKLVTQIELAADRQDVDDTIVERKLVELAIAGQALRAQFDESLEAFKDKSPLQIVSLLNGDVLPLELVYDGARLSASSKICSTWRDALRAGNCGGCAGGGANDDVAPARVCPMRFWSMHKVIERRTADARGGAFRVGSEPSATRARLRPVDAVVVGASGKFTDAEVEALRVRANNAFGVPAGRAVDWVQWRKMVKLSNPEMLVALAHDQPIAGGLSSALMLGEPQDDSPPPPSTELLAGGVSEAEVLGDEARPGPVVLLLGCNTQFMDGRLASFAGEFRENGAALTVATLGKLVVEQAPQAAGVLIDYFAHPPNGATTVGEIMLQARRQLLSDGMIMALLLVANGDANWQLAQ